MFSLSAKVKERFTEAISRLSDAELQNHQKVVAFKDSIKNSLNPGKAYADGRNDLNSCTAPLNAMYSGLIVDFDVGVFDVCVPV